MGACLHVETTQQTIHQNPFVALHTPQSSQSLYQLNDLRSLEGVARLWSRKMHNKQKGVLNLQNATSVRVQGNRQPCHQRHPFAPICISTYYFVHAPSAQKQPNLLHSHSAPPRLHSILNEQNLATQNNLSLAQNYDNDQSIVIEMDLPETDRKFSLLSPISSLVSSPTAAHANNHNSPRFVLPNPHPSLPEPISLIPVFSSSVASSENMVIDTNNGFHLNVGLDDIENKYDFSAADWVPVKHTYSNRSVFRMRSANKAHMHGNGLTTDDFMEFESKHSSSFNIGVGASGIVKKAFHFSSCKMVAIKECRSKQQHEILAFDKEASLYKEFEDNKHIIDIIGYGNGDTNNELLMALEYMDCGSAESLGIAEKFMALKQRELIVGYIALNVLLALRDLHNNLYVHNDIKPANILANKSGEIKLSDFGTMLKLEHIDDYFKKNNGTQRYQSPEKTIFDIHYNCKSDIWSLGITCYELLFGAQINDNDIKYSTSPPILDVNDIHCTGLSINCCDFVNKCLTINQYHRPSAEDLLGHEWLHDIKCVALKDKWPWLLIGGENGSGRNEDLLFMISALIIYYSSKDFSDINNGSNDHILHRRVSAKPAPDGSDGDKQQHVYSDEERISNIAKYALCSKDTVMDRIKVTVSYIKSQL